MSKIISIIIFYICFIIRSSAAAAALHTRIDVHTYPNFDGKKTFEYTITNMSDSEFPVVFFGLSIDDTCDSMTITSPTGWSSTNYTPSEAWIPWETARKAIMPGHHARFALTGNCKFSRQTFSIMGPDPNKLYMRDDMNYYSNEGYIDWKNGVPNVGFVGK